ncbi:hypothetical protein BDF14DRAFT_1782223 [Spinellus fusiger]|nr:hypothetical protein BDF14DRAFT_1782223 [Spinellus fusiger]
MDSESLLPSLDAHQGAPVSASVWQVWQGRLVWLWRFCIFGMVGSSSAAVTRFLLRSLQGSGWVYYLWFFIVEFPVYTMTLVLVGSCLGQWRFFCRLGLSLWSWCLPKTIYEQGKALLEPSSYAPLSMAGST